MQAVLQVAVASLILGPCLAWLELQHHSKYDMRGFHPHFKDYQSYHHHIDIMDLDLILASRRLVHNYVACLVDAGPCNSEGDELKKILPDAITTKCSKCTLRQKEGARKVINTLQSRYPYEWRILLRRWNLLELQKYLY